jgi:hypothetical protein
LAKPRQHADCALIAIKLQKVRGGVIIANISRLGLDGNLLFMISYKATGRKVAVRSIG